MPVSGLALYPWVVHLLRVFAIAAGALVLSKISGRLLRSLRARFQRSMTERRHAPHLEVEKRAATLTEIFRTTIAVAIYTLGLMMALHEVGFDVRPLIAGAGIVGLAVGFGAQTLVRDIISGVFLLLENQIRIDDYVVVNGTSGRVEELNLRTTVLRGNDGAIHIFRNGAINTLSNLTFGYSYYVFQIRVGYQEDTDRVSQALREIAAQLASEEPYRSAVLEPLEVLGIDQFADGAAVLQARIKTLPTEQWTVGRELNRRIKKRFDELKIQMR